MSEYFDNKARDWDADDMVKQLSSAIGSAILEQVPLHNQMDVMDFGAAGVSLDTGGQLVVTGDDAVNLDPQVGNRVLANYIC